MPGKINMFTWPPSLAAFKIYGTHDLPYTRNMGTMESHVWSVIAKRMKHNHTSWSKRGGNHLAKILAKKCSGKLYEVTQRLKLPSFEPETVEEVYGEILLSAKAPKKDGKGYEYPVIGHLVGLEGKVRGDGRKLLAMAGY